MTNKNFLKSMIFSFFLLFTYGCATNNQITGNNTNNCKEISNGMSYIDVVKICGEPDKKEIFDNYKELWAYKSKFLSLYTRKLVLFENGIVVDHEVQYK